MDINTIFENAITDIKNIKETWNESVRSSNGLDKNDYFDVDGITESEYQFVKKQCDDAFYRAIDNVIISLSKECFPNKEIFFLDYKTMRIYSSKKEGRAYPCNIGESGKILALIEEVDGVRVLSIFRRFGINNMIPSGSIHELKEELNFVKHRYISYVSKDAYKEILDTTNPEIDCKSQSSVFSLKYYIEETFGEKTYNILVEAVKKFNNKVDEYMGVTVVRKLKPNALFVYKRLLLDKIRNWNFDGIANRLNLETSELDDNQKKLIDEQFINDEYCRAMVGSCEFAKSFMTAEWLYDAIGNTGFIDETAIAMGYLKAVEQLLYAIVEFNVYEKTGRQNTIDAGKEQKNDLTEEVLAKKREYITLGNLTFFFKRKGNRTLLREVISEDTFGLIGMVMEHTKDLRNGYFHKDNLHDWNLVQHIREDAYSLFYLVLGAYDFRNVTYEEMGIDRDDDDDYIKLCEYFHKTASSDSVQEIPIFYINGATGNNFYNCMQDQKIDYAENGEPIYSGIYFKRPGPVGPNNYVMIMDKEHLADKIEKGRLIIHQVQNEMKFDVTGPEELIFSKGKFVYNKK